MERPKELSLDQQIERIRKDVVELAKKLRISPRDALAFLSHRELVIINTQLTHLHEMFDLLYGEKEAKAKKAKGGKR